jgi:glutaminase
MGEIGNLYLRIKHVVLPYPITCGIEVACAELFECFLLFQL